VEEEEEEMEVQIVPSVQEMEILEGKVIDVRQGRLQRREEAGLG
jgi:hypothetical protein